MVTVYIIVYPSTEEQKDFVVVKYATVAGPKSTARTTGVVQKVNHDLLN